MIRQAWENIRNEPHTPGWQYRRIQLASGIDFFAAVEFPSLDPILYVEVPTQSISVTQFPEIRGLHPHLQATEKGQRGRTRFSLRCSDRASEVIFEAFGRDLHLHLDRSTKPGAAQELMVTRLQMWVDFFRRGQERCLSPQEEAGLVAELFFLEYVASKSSIAKAVEAWQGPLRLPQDFVFETRRFEIKSVVKPGNAKIRVSNERQLEVPSDTRLDLVLARLDEGGDGGDTLPELVARLHDQAEAEGHSLPFKDRLLRTGYADHQNEKFSRRFRCKRFQAYQVGADFPRLTSLNLHPSISEVKYSLWSDDLSPFQTELAECFS